VGSGFGYGDGDSPHYPASCRRQLFLFYRLPGRTLHLVDELLSSWSWSWSFCSFSSFCATMPSVFGFHLSADCQLINGSARFPWCFMQLRIYIAYTPCGDDGWMENPKIGRGFSPPSVLATTAAIMNFDFALYHPRNHGCFPACDLCGN